MSETPAAHVHDSSVPVEPPDVFDVAVIGSGPAGAQAAVSAAHQMRSVLVVEAGGVSQRKGRAFWNKSVDFLDVPVFPGITGPKLSQALVAWMGAQPGHVVTISGVSRHTGIWRRAGMVLRVTRGEAPDGATAPAGYLFEIEASTKALKPGVPLTVERFRARSLVIASGFEDVWPDIEVTEGADRLYQSHRVMFRYAGNRKGWHVCIRCDGHLHVDEHLAIVASGDFGWHVARGAQDFTAKATIFTNGEPPALSEARLAVLKERGIAIETEPIVAHIGKGNDLLGLRLASGREVMADGFFVDYGLKANREYLRPEDGWDPKVDDEGLLVVDDDGAVLGQDDEPIPGLFAAGDIVSGEYNLIATAFGLGQNAGLAAADMMRAW
ncbi:MAG: NAD(P)/FAD-dependent oxidoreductase [Chloroflexi bacterium]|nr:NAD(P)/FAD-dependent oxidoreductase [Chloroflexota bacterium]